MFRQSSIQIQTHIAGPVEIDLMPTTERQTADLAGVTHVFVGCIGIHVLRIGTHEPEDGGLVRTMAGTG